MNRREFIRSGTVAALGGFATAAILRNPTQLVLQSCIHSSPTHSIIPVVGDGKWIWTEPPQQGTGYLEPRSYELSIGVELEGTGGATQIKASTPVPVEHAEQKVDNVRLETQGCQAQLRELAPGAGQLILAAPSIAKGQVVRAIAHYKLTLFKRYDAYTAEKFPAKQPAPPPEVRKAALQDSPGIQTSSPAVKSLAAELTKPGQHSWHMAGAFHEWIRRHIRPHIGSYTSVVAALEHRRGDCEEMAAVFVALCRAVQIPARLVWVPNHNWAEFYLTDNDGKGHWIPAHTACYSWFGWNGAHELVIQKGDRVSVPEERKQFRLLEDWSQWMGRKPLARFGAELKPFAAKAGDDAGPGARSKDAKGEWVVVGKHELDRYVRR